MNHASLILGDLSEVQQAHKQKLMAVLKRYMPLRAVEYCSELMMFYHLHLHIEVERYDRLGDYSPHGKGNRISINHNLNPYDFLITFIHELAHHVTHKKHGPNHQSHGHEWKQTFKDCMKPFMARSIFPADIAEPLKRHMQYPRYTHTADADLMRVLIRYDKGVNHLLDQLPEGALFKLRKNDKMILKKGKALKNHFLCVDLHKGNAYKVFSAAKVFPVSAAKN